MIWAIIGARIIFWALLGSFGTAYLHERTGRDVQMGGILGLFVGGVGGIFFLVLLWLWIYYGSASYNPVGRVYRPAGAYRRRWYNWWG